MNLLRLFLLSFLLITVFNAYSQQGFLFVKKGFHKKRTYTEGHVIHLKLEDGSHRKGVITLLRNDSIFISGQPVSCRQITEIILDKKRNKAFPDVKTLLLIGAGSALTTAGLTLSKQADFKTALTAGIVIGYGPLLVRYLGGTIIHVIKRKRFRIGRKFRLQVLDFYLPGSQKGF